MFDTDPDFVLLQPEYDIPNQDEWVLLESEIRHDSVTANGMYHVNLEETDQVNVANRDGRMNAVDDDHLIEWRISNEYLFGVCILLMSVFTLTVYCVKKFEYYPEPKAIKRDLQRTYEVALAAHNHLYPSPAVPPPRYDEALEAMLEPPETRVTYPIQANTTIEIPTGFPKDTHVC